MKKTLPEKLNNKLNAEVLRFLEGASCHSDIVLPITKVLGSYAEVKAFCPDSAHFSYICWHVNNVIFAYAIGMKHVSFRLPQHQGSSLSNQEIKTDYIKNENFNWVSFPYDTNKLNELVASSYEYANNA